MSKSTPLPSQMALPYAVSQTRLLIVQINFCHALMLTQPPPTGLNKYF